MAAPKTYNNLIDGEWVPSRSGQTFENLNPADTRDVVGIFQRSNKEDVDAAVAAAKRAWESWRLVPAPRRAEIIFRAGEMGIRIPFRDWVIVGQNTAFERLESS